MVVPFGENPVLSKIIGKVKCILHNWKFLECQKVIEKSGK